MQHHTPHTAHHTSHIAHRTPQTTHAPHNTCNWLGVHTQTPRILHNVQVTYVVVKEKQKPQRLQRINLCLIIMMAVAVIVSASSIGLSAYLAMRLSTLEEMMTRQQADYQGLETILDSVTKQLDGYHQRLSSGAYIW